MSSKSDRECGQFNIKDVVISALGLSVALPWTEAIKGDFEVSKICFAIKITIIVAIIAIILNYMHVFTQSIKDSMVGDHPLGMLEPLGSIW
jgi:hypothetical protein